MMIWARFTWVVMFVGALLVLAPVLAGQQGAWAQSTDVSGTAGPGITEAEKEALSGQLSPAEVDDLLARLSDSDVRELLLYQLEQAAAQRAQAAVQEKSVVQQFEDDANVIRENFLLTLAEIENLPSVLPFAIDRLADGRAPGFMWWFLLGVAAMFIVAAIAEWLMRRFTKALRERLEAGQVGRYRSRAYYVVLRVVYEAVARAVFVLAALLVFFSLYQGGQATRTTVMTYLAATLFVLITESIVRLLLAPGRDDLRLVKLPHDTAAYVYRCTLWFAVLVSFGVLTCHLLLTLGLGQRLHDMLQMIIGLIAVTMLIVMIWRCREPVSAAIRGPVIEGVEGGKFRPFLAQTWAGLAILYVLIIYVSSLYSRLSGENLWVGAGIGSLLIIVAVPLIEAALGYFLTLLFTGEGDDRVTLEASPYFSMARRIGRFILILLAVMVFAQLWGIPLFSFAQSDFGARVMRTVLDIGFTVLIAYIVWEITKAAIDSQLAADGDDAPVAELGSEGGGQGASRLKTLLPLIKRFIQVTLIVMAGMIILSSFGVDIGPLIAGAGVVGVAIGFGAQTLVRDIVSGVFFLLDDAFRMGEYVDVGDAKGTVEAINVRSLVLRHHRGPLHTIPFGEIQYLTNFSRDWVIMKLQFRVTYDTDVKKVKKIFKQIGQELMDDEILGPKFIEPLKSQGVLAMEDSAMILRAKFMAVPGEQFMIRKEVYTRVQQAFHDNGIKFAHKRVTVDLPPGVDPESETGKAMTAAAAAAEEQKAPQSA